jgi:hypothetical protein
VVSAAGEDALIKLIFKQQGHARVAAQAWPRGYEHGSRDTAATSTYHSASDAPGWKMKEAAN